MTVAVVERVGEEDVIGDVGRVGCAPDTVGVLAVAIGETGVDVTAAVALSPATLPVALVVVVVAPAVPFPISPPIGNPPTCVFPLP